MVCGVWWSKGILGPYMYSSCDIMALASNHQINICLIFLPCKWIGQIEMLPEISSNTVYYNGDSIAICKLIQYPKLGIYVSTQCNVM